LEPDFGGSLDGDGSREKSEEGILAAHEGDCPKRDAATGGLEDALETGIRLVAAVLVDFW